MSPDDINKGSLWFESRADEDTSSHLADTAAAQPGKCPTNVDVAIIGAGYTGLWTALYLNQHRPELNIGVFEANTIGFGASGRNGGWCMGWSMGIDERLNDPQQAAAGLALARAMRDTVDEVGRVCDSNGIDCHFSKGGMLTLATRAFDAEVVQRRIEHLRDLGFAPGDFVWLDRNEAVKRFNAPSVTGALYTPHGAAIHPARLVHGLADLVRERGVRIYERTAVRRIRQGELDTDSGSVKAPVILRATEGYTDSIAGQQRALLPVYSMMVATEPLSDAMWQDIGLRERETFGDRRRVVIYGQRTRDNRIAFGGRSGYYFGSKRFAVMPQDHPDDIRVESTLKALLPILQEVQITHRWGGPLGVPRHWRPCVTFNSKTGFGTAGGYTGEGVAASNLAGRILADLVSGEQTDITKLAWVDDNARHWEREPLRWMGAKTAEWLASAADRREAESGKPSRVLGGLFSAITGH